MTNERIAENPMIDMHMNVIAQIEADHQPLLWTDMKLCDATGEGLAGDDI